MNHTAESTRGSLSVPPPGSITCWIARLKHTDPEAAQRLWERYFTRLVELARRKLAHHPRRGADEEDVALSAFASLCRAAASGRFPLLTDRHDLWALLIRLTERKAIDLVRHEGRQRRGGGRVRGDSVVRLPEGSAEGVSGFDGVIDPRPGPELAAMVAEEMQYLMEQLDDDVQRAIARLKLDGYSNPEIAEQLDRPLRTVERKLALIRKIWTRTEEP